MIEFVIKIFTSRQSRQSRHSRQSQREKNENSKSESHNHVITRQWFFSREKIQSQITRDSRVTEVVNSPFCLASGDPMNRKTRHFFLLISGMASWIYSALFLRNGMGKCLQGDNQEYNSENIEICFWFPANPKKDERRNLISLLLQIWFWFRTNTKIVEIFCQYRSNLRGEKLC